jgi:hypothetical protein
MNVRGISAAGSAAPSPQVQGPAQHKHGKHHSQSISDVDAQSSSVANAAGGNNKVGSRVDITV